MKRMDAYVDITMYQISHVFSFENQNVGRNHNVKIITLIILNENVLLQSTQSAVLVIYYIYLSQENKLVYITSILQ